MGLALYCHGELKLTNGRNGREGRYKEEDEAVPTSLSTPPSSPKCVLRASTLPKMVSPRESRRNSFNFATSAQLPLNVVPTSLSVQKMRAIQRSTLASGTQRLKMQAEWRSTLNSNAERWKMQEECGSALSSSA